MKYCLIIDNDDQSDKINELQKKSRHQGFPITCYYFKPDKREYLRLEIINGEQEYIIDTDLLKEDLEKEFKGRPIDLIASDYLLEDKLIDGLGLLQFLKENWRGQNVPTLIYSGKNELIKEKLQKEIKSISSDADALTEFMNKYRDNHPDEVLSRDTYIDDIINFLKKPRNKTSLNTKLSQKLMQHPNNVFENIFPRFEKHPLNALAKLVVKNTEESDVFEDEFLDRSVDYFIYLKE